MRGRPDGTPWKRISQTDTMNTKIDELFATLRGLVADQLRDLAMAMAERDRAVTSLKDAEAERDKALTERDASRAGYAAMSRRIYGQGGECFELDKARAERDTARQSLRAAEQDCDDMQSINSDLRTVNARLIAERDAAMERLNHAESLIMQ
jgi:hypothetical protein